MRPTPAARDQRTRCPTGTTGGGALAQRRRCLCTRAGDRPPAVRARAVTAYLVATACIFAVNLLPAFGPPTWAVLVFFRLNSELPAVPLVLLGALAAASGRLVLATTARRFRSRFSAERRE